MLTSPGFWLSTRFSVAIIAFLGFVNLYALRVNLSVAIVCMTNDTAIESTANGTHECRATNSTINHIDGPFTWSKSVQGVVLSSFFYGYLFTQIPGGLLAEKFGGRNVFGGFMLAAAIATIMSPIAAKQSYIALIACRIILGLAEAVAYPATHALWSNWAPPFERSKLIGFTYAGSQIGNVITFPLAAYLCASVSWESIFYIWGSFGLLWCILWQLLVSSTPGESRRIKESEKDYIMASLEGQINADKQERIAVKDMPWVDMLTSLPLWAIIIGHFSANYGTYLMLTSLPLYMEQVLNFDIKSNGLYSALPYVAYFLGINISSFAADNIRQRRILSTTTVRKLMMGFALTGQAAFLISAGYCKCGQEIRAVVFIIIAQGISGFQYAGYAVNHIDIAPRFAGTLFGISNTIATIGGIIAPSIVAALTPNGTRDEWTSVFWVAFGILVFGAVFYVVFGSGELQTWNDAKIKESKNGTSIIITVS